MKISVVIDFTKEESQLFREAFSNFELIDPTPDHWRAANRFMVQKCVDIECATAFMGVLDAIRIEVEKETDCVADPAWVASAAKAEAEGKATVVKHPEQAVEMLRDIRRGQLKTILEAILTLQTGINNANTVKGLSLDLG